MAYPKTLLDTAKMTAIADAVRAKTGTTELMTAAQIAEAIENIPQGGGGDLDALIDGSITEITSSVTALRESAFSACTQLEVINLPNVITIGAAAFYKCSNLKSARFLKATKVGNTAFAQCANIESIFCPQMTSLVYGQTFNYCPKLRVLDAGNCSSIAGTAFNEDRVLDTLIIRKNSVTYLINMDAFNNTPFASNGAGGTLYVPASLIEVYKTAANWSTLFGDNRAAGYANNQILPIEGSEYEL